MSTEEALEKMKQDIFDSLPKSAKITEVQFEGPEISIYSRSVDFIGDDREEIRNLVKKLRKRIVVRSDPEIRMINDETVAFIQKQFPKKLK